MGAGQGVRRTARCLRLAIWPQLRHLKHEAGCFSAYYRAAITACHSAPVLANPPALQQCLTLPELQRLWARNPLQFYGHLHTKWEPLPVLPVLLKSRSASGAFDVSLTEPTRGSLPVAAVGFLTKPVQEYHLLDL